MTNATPDSDELEQNSSGITELDELLRGGYLRGRIYLVQGVSGAGKSLIGQHFLEAGLENGENVVYIHGEESKKDILTNTRQVDIHIDEAEFLDIGPGTDFFAEDISYEIVDTADVESERYTQDIHEVIEDVNPSRVLIDPISQLKYVERDEYQYRKRLQSFIRFLKDRNITVIGTRTIGRRPHQEAQSDIESLSDGIISLFLEESERRIAVLKHRGIGQRSGTHGLEIRADGIEVFPQLLPSQDTRTFNPEVISTGDDGLDSLLCGGIERGSVTFLSGPSGIGKSTLGMQILEGPINEARNAIGYLFEESIEQFSYRAEQLGIPISNYRENEQLVLQEIEPLLLSAEEFAVTVKRDVAAVGADVVLIDGLSGFKIALQGDEQRLVRRLHALTRVLKNQGVSVIITHETEQLLSRFSQTGEDTNYLADNILVLSYVEMGAELLRTIGVIKKRLGDFDNRFHRFTIDPEMGISVGDPVDSADGNMYEKAGNNGNE